jgi:hypothetical protein
MLLLLLLLVFAAGILLRCNVPWHTPAINISRSSYNTSACYSFLPQWFRPSQDQSVPSPFPSTNTTLQQGQHQQPQTLCAGCAASSVGLHTSGHMSLHAGPEAGTIVQTAPMIFTGCNTNIGQSHSDQGEHRRVFKPTASAHVHGNSDHTGVPQETPSGANSSRG